MNKPDPMNKPDRISKNRKKRPSRPMLAGFDKQVGVGRVIMSCIICALLAVTLTCTAIFAKFGGGKTFKSALKYAEVQKTIENNYIGDSDSQKLKDAAAAAMVTSLGDKWSYYMTAQEYEAYKLHSANQYAGIGVTVTKDDKTGGFKLDTVTENTPAATAGLKAGMVIMKVDGEDATKLTVDGLRDVIQSKLNSKLVLTVSDNGSSSDYTLDCSIIYSNPVTYELKDKGVGYVKIANFEAGSGDAAINAIEKLISQGATSMVFDVRDNPGGMLAELIKVLDYILPEGDVFVSVDQGGKETVTKSDNVCIEMKMVVLINENTYSAAEYFAAALKEYIWATTVGTHTTGKGRSQTTIELSDGSAVHISSRKYLTPKRVDLSQQGGIAPDIVVQNTAAADGESKTDSQLEKAIDTMY